LIDKRKTLAGYRLETANDCMSSAKLEFDAGKYKASANRVYYAMFHAIRAVLALDGVDFKKHSAVISQFRQSYIKTGIFDSKYSDTIKHMFNVRMDSDYEDFYVISKDEVKEQIDEIIYFISAVTAYITTQKPKSS